MESKYGLSKIEAAIIKKTKAYSGGGQGIMFHIATLDNLRKHQRLLRVEPAPSQAILTAPGYGFEKLMTRMQDKTILYSIPKGEFRPTKGNTLLSAEIFLNEAPAGIGDHPALLALRVYGSWVKTTIMTFP